MTNAEWISVKDRLPEVGKQVLLIVYGWEHSIVYIGKLWPGWYKAYLRRGNSCLNIPIVPSDWLIDGWSYFKAPDVRYWMKLPELPYGLHRYSLEKGENNGRIQDKDDNRVQRTERKNQ